MARFCGAARLFHAQIHGYRMIFKLFLVIFALFALSKTVNQYRHKRVSLHWCAIWTCFWVIVIVVAFLPQTTDIVARYVGVERGADLLVYLAVVLLSYGFYRALVNNARHDREITELVRRLAITEVLPKETEIEVVESVTVTDEL